MITLIAAAVLAAQAPVVPAAADPMTQHVHAQSSKDKGMDCCKDCCKDMDKTAGHDMDMHQHGEHGGR